jgi:hypothetical protein
MDSSSTETRPIILVCGCQKYRQYLVAALIRFTRPEWRCVGILGDPTLDAPVLKGNILTLPVPDTYEALPAKLHAAFKWIAETFPASPGIFKTDDDIVVNDLPALVEQIAAYAVLPYWGFRVGHCSEGAVAEKRIAERFTDTSLRPTHQAASRYAFGGGYWIGREALPILIAAEATYRESVLEDVCTGFVLNAAGIEPPRIFLAHFEIPRTPEYLRIR